MRGAILSLDRGLEENGPGVTKWAGSVPLAVGFRDATGFQQCTRLPGFGCPEG